MNAFENGHLKYTPALPLFKFLKYATVFSPHTRPYSVPKKIPPLKFSDIFSQTVGIFSPNFICLFTFLSTLDYKFLFNYLQL